MTNMQELRKGKLAPDWGRETDNGFVPTELEAQLGLQPALPQADPTHYREEQYGSEKGPKVC